MSENRLKRMQEISEELAALVDKERALHQEMAELEPTLPEWIESSHGRWRGPYAYYDAQHDLLHIFFEDAPAVVAWRQDGLHIAFDHNDMNKVVGATIWDCRHWIEAEAKKKEV